MSEVIPSFFTDSKVNVSHTTTIDNTNTTDESKLEDGSKFEDYFQIEKSVDTVNQYQFKRIALQLPDTLLWASSRISHLIQRGAKHECQVFILGDTSYGSCCVDEVTASHLGADFIIHYGHSCLSPATKLPVQYVFGKESFNMTLFTTTFKNTFSSTDKILIFYQLSYQHISESIQQSLTGYPLVITTEINNFNNILLSLDSHPKINTENNDIKPNNNNNNNSCSTTTTCCNNNNNNNNNNNCSNNSNESSSCCGQKDNSSSCCSNTNNNNDLKLNKTESIDIDNNIVFGRKLGDLTLDKIEDYKIVWIGKECTTLTNLLMNFNKNIFYRCDINNDNYIIKQESLPRNQGLMKRYYISQKCKEADIIGIVVATLTVQKYGETIDSLKKLIIKCGKKPYVFVVGRLNVPKLANFSEIDMFVIVACPENTLVDSKEYFKPIATPWELNIALRRTDWTGEYITDFSRLFPKLSQEIDGDDESKRREDEVSDDEGNKYHFSLTSGKITRYASSTTSTSTDPSSKQLVSMDDKFKQLSTNAPTAGDIFQSRRTYYGLEPKIGETEVIKAVVGRSGIPMQYDSEPTSSNNNNE